MSRILIRKAKSGVRRAHGYIDSQVRLLPARLMGICHKLPEMRLEELVGAHPLPGGSPIFDDICLPPYQGPKDHNDLEPFLRLLDYQAPRVVLELGTAQGNLTANICRYCPSAMVYTVNAPAHLQTGSVTTYSLSEDDIGAIYRRYGYSDRVIQIFANTLTLDLTPYLKNGMVDLAIVDACHDTDYVLNDFHKIRNFVRPGGIVLFHDTHPSLKAHLVGSYMACMLLRREGYDIRHLSNTWWAIWQCSAKIKPSRWGRRGSMIDQVPESSYVR